jgi:hypothetical protein
MVAAVNVQEVSSLRDYAISFHISVSLPPFVLTLTVSLHQYFLLFPSVKN